MPLSLSSTFHAGGDRAYLRDGSPTTDAFEAVVGALDGGVATSFASGVAAFAAVLDGLPTGAVVVAPSSMYWGSIDLLRTAEALGRLSVRTVDIADTDAVLAALPGADLVWIETPTNPLIVGGRRARDLRRGPGRRGRAAASTRRSPPRCASARSSRARTWSCTRPPNTWPATPTC